MIDDANTGLMFAGIPIQSRGATGHLAYSLPPALLIILALAGCGQTGPRAGAITRSDEVDHTEEQVVKGAGTIIRYELEGGFFAIRGDNGTTYDPINLPQSFHKDKLRVYFEGRIRSDIAGTHMIGPLIELIRINPL